MTIYDPQTQKAVILNPTATAVWSCADGTLGDVGIAALLAKQFVQVPDSVTPHVSKVLDEFDRLGLLEHRDPPRRRR